jgi:hypothetical protein
MAAGRRPSSRDCSEGALGYQPVTRLTMRPRPIVLLFAAASIFALARDSSEAFVLRNLDRDRRVFVLAGEAVRFDGDFRPQFTADQIRNSAEATRAGLARFAATPSGRDLIELFASKEFEVIVTEDSDAPGAGRAPQPGIATLVAAGDQSKTKSYDLVLNPTCDCSTPKGMKHVPTGEPSTITEMMAAAWAGEMLHIAFYARGISLPHHQRADFQEEWHVMATELGFPNLAHDDGDEGPRGGGRSIIIGSESEQRRPWRGRH